MGECCTFHQMFPSKLWELMVSHCIICAMWKHAFWNSCCGCVLYPCFYISVLSSCFSFSSSITFVVIIVTHMLRCLWTWCSTGERSLGIWWSFVPWSWSLEGLLGEWISDEWELSHAIVTAIVSLCRVVILQCEAWWKWRATYQCPLGTFLLCCWFLW